MKEKEIEIVVEDGLSRDEKKEMINDGQKFFMRERTRVGPRANDPKKEIKSIALEDRKRRRRRRGMIKELRKDEL